MPNDLLHLVVGFFTADIEGASLAASIIVDNWKPISDKEPITWGIPEGPYLEKASQEGLQHFYQTCEILVEAGIQVKYIDMLINFEEIIENHDNLLKLNLLLCTASGFRSIRSFAARVIVKRFFIFCKE